MSHEMLPWPVAVTLSVICCITVWIMDRNERKAP